jgi:hypothetical protein
MDTRLRKLRLALWIMGLGTIIALIWHGWQGWGLGRGYPYNSYLSTPDYRFSDFTDHLRASRRPCPYDGKVVGLYFPATYVWLKTFTVLPQGVALLLFLSTSLFGLLLMQSWSLRKVLPSMRAQTLAAMGLTFGSYAIMLCLDRANIELPMALLVGGALLFCQQRKFDAAAALICLTICLKLYTALLLVAFLRRHHLRQVVLPVVGFVVISYLSLLTFSPPVAKSYALWQDNFHLYNQFYILFNLGLGGSSSPWNLCKITFLALDHWGWLHLHLDYNRNPRTFAAAMYILLAYYKVLVMVGLIGAVAFVTFIEREFFRRFLLLLLLTPFASQSGADYRLLYFQIALILLILLPAARRHDFRVTALLALLLVPKKELFLAFVGPTDTTFNDVSIGVLINPILVLLAIALLMADAWVRRVPGWGLLRFRGLLQEAFSPLKWLA